MSGHGSFDGLIEARWLLDGRKMVLLKQVVFTDSKQVTWTTPERATIDGASVPQVFWSFLAGPFEGKHRDASVIHDFECCVRLRPWRAVHRMYYDAMMTRNEEKWRAKLMYWAVYWFGPRWPEAALDVGFTEEDVGRAAEYFQQNPDIPLEDIEGLDTTRLRERLMVVSQQTMMRHALKPGVPVRPVVPRQDCFDGRPLEQGDSE